MGCTSSKAPPSGSSPPVLSPPAPPVESGVETVAIGAIGAGHPVHEPHPSANGEGSGAIGANGVRAHAQKRAFVFLAVNGSSGGQVAQELLDMSLPRFDVALRDGHMVTVHVFNLKTEKDREKAFETVAQLAKDEEENDVRVVACGGDGTVKWVISCLVNVNVRNVPIGVIPFGTGNDLSRVMGWGSTPPSPLIGVALVALRKRLQKMFDAEKIPLDVWICTITLGDGENAKFEEVKNKKIVQTHHGKKSISQEMINYFSVGADGELMFSFEQNRRSSQFANKRVYARQGFYQSILQPKRLSKFIDTVTMAKEGQSVPLKYNDSDRQLLFLNIPSYAAGADLWKPSSEKSSNGFKSQYVGDRKVEVLTVRATSDIGVSLTTGTTFGIHQTTQGHSFDMTFKPDSKAYFQVDGEAVKATGVASVSVRHGFQVQMLRSHKGKAIPYGDDFVPPVDAPRSPTEEESSAVRQALDDAAASAEHRDGSALGAAVQAAGAEVSRRGLEASNRRLDQEDMDFDNVDDEATKEDEELDFDSSTAASPSESLPEKSAETKDPKQIVTDAPEPPVEIVSS